MAHKGGARNQPLSIEYDDRVLFGPREKVVELINRNRTHNDSECVIFSVGTFADKKQWKLKELVGIDRRLRAITDDLNLRYAMPIQGYCWPKMSTSLFPIICISPQGSGKTFGHLLYIVSACIKSISVNITDNMILCENEHQYEPDQGIDPDELITHPNYMIVCSSQHQAEQLVRHVCLMKEKAYKTATEMRCLSLPPVVNSISVHHDDQKLALRCSQSEILMTTPNALLKCHHAGYINFSRCKKIIFDDLDLALQLHNTDIFTIFKIYLSEQLEQDRLDNSEQPPNIGSRDTQQGPSPFCFFSRKWTDLVRNFTESISLQRVLIFGSIAEASIYSKLKFDIEPYKTHSSKMDKLVRLLKLTTDDECAKRIKIAVVCETDDEATELSQKLQSHGFLIKLITQEQSDEHIGRTRLKQKVAIEPIRVISDGALELEVDVLSSANPLNTINHVIHFSMPSDMLKFDSRFRLMYKNIQNNEKDLLATIFIGPNFRSSHAKQLFDLLCRSPTTLTGTKLLLKDFLNSKNDPICWRWATTGSCRLEKLSRGDKFGTYCFDRHQVGEGPSMESYPTSGQVKIILTHVISPSEFYFQFEAHRDMQSIKWKKFESSGSQFMRNLQQQLDKLRDAQLRSVPLAKIVKGKVYGVYFQDETRVDRVLLLDEPKHEVEPMQQLDGFNRHKIAQVNEELEFTKQVPVVRIDYGSKLDVFIKNLIELPASLASIPAQCHRGFYLGFKPADNEPFWLYKAKKAFFDSVNGNDVTVWLRLNSNNCFWFEHMQVTTRILDIVTYQTVLPDPYKILCSTGFAVPVSSKPNCLLPSVRDQTVTKWNSDQLNKVARQAFLRTDSAYQHLFILNIKPDFTLVVRHTDFNKQLINLEDDLQAEYESGVVTNLKIMVDSMLCLVKVSVGFNPDTKIPMYALNRAKLIETLDYQEDLDSPNNERERKYKVYCLDHGDFQIVPADDLYMMSKEHVARLPFQAMEVKLANVNHHLLEDVSLRNKVKNLIIDETRNENNNMKAVKCILDEQRQLHLLVPDADFKTYVPLTKIMEDLHGIKIYELNPPDLD